MPFHYCAFFVFYRNMKSKDICIKSRHEITSTRAQNTTYVIDKVCMIVSRLLKIYLKRIFTRTFYHSLSDHRKTGQNLKYLKQEISEFNVSRKYHKLTPYPSGSRISQCEVDYSCIFRNHLCFGVGDDFHIKENFIDWIQ